MKPHSTLFKLLLCIIILFSSLTITQNLLLANETLTLTANPRFIKADGTSTSALTADIDIAYGAPVGGYTVHFWIDQGTGTISPEYVQTNSSGIATTTYTSSTTPGEVLLKAEATVQIPPERNGGTKRVWDMEVVWLVKVTFVPSSIDIGTDGIGVTIRSGEREAVTATVEPNNITVDFSIADPNQASVTPSSGMGTVNLTVTSVGDTDTVLRASKNLWMLGNASVRLHKPKKLEFTNVYDVPPPPGKNGDIEERHYDVYDFQNRLTDITDYFVQEFVTMVENDDGLGGSYPEVVPSSGASNYSDLVDNLAFTFDAGGTLEPGHKYKWNQKFQILGLDVENNLWKHDFRRVDATHLEIDSFSGQW